MNITSGHIASKYLPLCGVCACAWWHFPRSGSSQQSSDPHYSQSSLFWVVFLLLWEMLEDRLACAALGGCHPALCTGQAGLTGVGGEKAERSSSLKGGRQEMRIHTAFQSVGSVFCVASFCPHSDPLREVVVIPT